MSWPLFPFGMQRMVLWTYLKWQLMRDGLGFHPSLLSLSFIFKMYIFAYLFLAVLSLHCWASSGGFSCYRAWALGPTGFSGCSMWTQQLLLKAQEHELSSTPTLFIPCCHAESSNQICKVCRCPFSPSTYHVKVGILFKFLGVTFGYCVPFM